MKKTPTHRRAYDSSSRRAVAAATRARIAECARRLFARDGYGASSMEAIAREAGVAVPTVYAAYGSKRAILFALLDAADSQADVAGLRRDLRKAAGYPRRQLRLLVSFIARFYTQAADLVEVARGAGSTENDLAALWKTGEERRLKGQAPVVRAWTRAGVLRDGLSEKEALDVLWSLTGADNYRLFVVERGWASAKYEAWLAAALERLLFR